MSAESDIVHRLAERLREGARTLQPIDVAGSGSKAFLYPSADGEAFSIASHAGIVDYAPSELCVTARAGTPLAALDAELRTSAQMLPFDPPRFGGDGTLGGALSAGFSGPGRPWHGAARDAVLGVMLMNGAAEVLRFGGRVMKNVAGFDVSRLVVGAHGCLGVILEATVKVSPRPEAERTLRFECSRDDALARVVAWGRTALPITATCHVDDALLVRLSGSEAGVAAGAAKLGGDAVADAESVWSAVRDHAHRFFSARTANAGKTLWRLALPYDASYPELDGDWLTEWGGAQRWLVSDGEAATIERAARDRGGYAQCFSTGGGLATVDPVLHRYHARLKAAFDPHGLLNLGRMPAAR